MTQSTSAFDSASFCGAILQACNFTVGPKSSEVTFECWNKDIIWSSTLFLLFPVLQVQHGCPGRFLVGKTPTVVATISLLLPCSIPQNPGKIAVVPFLPLIEALSPF